MVVVNNSEMSYVKEIRDTIHETSSKLGLLLGPST